MSDRLFQARVDEWTATRLQSYAKAKPKKMSESELVKYALDLVIDEADRQLAALQKKKVMADATRTAHALTGASASTPTNTAAQLGPGVLAGSKVFQAKIKEAKAARLDAIRRAYDASDSKLIRRGFKLILDEMLRNKTQLLKQLEDDYLATRAALEGADDHINTSDPNPAPVPEQRPDRAEEPDGNLIQATAGVTTTDGPPW